MDSDMPFDGCVVRQFVAVNILYDVSGMLSMYQAFSENMNLVLATFGVLVLAADERSSRQTFQAEAPLHLESIIVRHYPISQK